MGHSSNFDSSGRPGQHAPAIRSLLVFRSSLAEKPPGRFVDSPTDVWISLEGPEAKGCDFAMKIFDGRG
jgi:hypothetical protein